jgi:uncharacterized delta-60 repeat protein
MKSQFQRITCALILIIFGISSAPNEIPAQVTQQWAAVYAGPAGSEDYAKAIAVDGQGNVFVTGWSFGGSTFYDWATLKYSPTGQLLWAMRYDGPTHDWDCAEAMEMDAAGNVYVTGFTTNAISNKDILILKYSGTGALLWQAQYNGPASGNEAAHAICLDVNGNVYVTGESFGETSSFDFVTIKYNNQGVQQWAARYDGPAHYIDVAYDIAVDGDGSVYITGASWGGDFLGMDYATIKYDATGRQLWVQRYHHGPGKTDDQARALDLDHQGNVVVTGWSTGTMADDDDYATIKYNADGALQWVARYDGPAGGADRAFDVAVDTASGSVYVTGYDYGGATYDDFATLKYSSAGIQVWVVRHHQGMYDFCQSLALDAEGNIYITGGSTNYATFKYSPSGQVLWSILYNGPQNDDDQANDIAIDPAGCVYVTGQSGQFGNNDYATVKYTQATAPNLSLELIPFTAPIQIPANGGSFEYLLRTTNLNGSSQTTDFWAKVILPNGHLGGPLQTPLTTVLDTGVTVWQRQQMVPATAPSGNYTYIVCAGDYPSEIWASDSLVLTKLGTTASTSPEGSDQGWLKVHGQITLDPSLEVAVLPSLRCYNSSIGVVVNYELPSIGSVNLQVYDISGRLVKRQEWPSQAAGRHQFTWQTPSSGVFLVRLEAGGEVRVDKAVVVR